ncbi:MAG: radical SAM protein [Acidaminococcaceae bacterium]|nr:radical SAM protein [Acidaminococcaceae bacterium]
MEITMTEKPVIRNLILSLTGQCNYACAYCYAACHPAGRMPVETALQAVDLAGESGQPFILQFTGGEPLLAFSVLQAVTEHVEQKSYPAILQLQTNASLMTGEIADYLKEHKIATGISLDGRPPVNDSLRKMKDGGSASQATIRGIRLLADRKVPIGLTCVVTEANVKMLPGIVQMAYYLGNVRQIGFDLLRCQGRGTGLKPASPQAVTAAMEQCYALAKQLEASTGVHIRFSQLEKIRKIVSGKACAFGQCYAMHGEEAYVTSDGKVYACSSLVGNEAFLLGDVWQGMDPEKTVQVGTLIAAAMKTCNACPHFTACGGGCFTRWWGRDGKAAEEECAMQQVFAKYI